MAGVEHIVYRCPVCSRPSAEMFAFPEIVHEPTPEERERMVDDPVLASIAHEVLVCPCEHVWTWFDLEEDRYYPWPSLQRGK